MSSPGRHDEVEGCDDATSRYGGIVHLRRIPDLPPHVLHVRHELLGDVGRAASALRRGDAEALGGLLDDSHESLRRDYEVSTEALDRLVRTARDRGALGARLTGAGLGGSAVVLTTPDRASTLLDSLRRDYAVAFPAVPSGPARILPAASPA